MGAFPSPKKIEPLFLQGVQVERLGGALAHVSFFRLHERVVDDDVEPGHAFDFPVLDALA